MFLLTFFFFKKYFDRIRELKFKSIRVLCLNRLLSNFLNSHELSFRKPSDFITETGTPVNLVVETISSSEAFTIAVL